VLALVAAALAGLGLVAGYGAWRIWEQGQRDERRPADAIVVLGAAQYDGRPSPVFRARLDHAIELHQSGVAPVLVVTGGKAPGDRTTEAETARRYAIARGVDADDILAENEGRTTLESLRSVAAMLHERGLQEVVFVSDRTHMLRVLRIARDEGLTAFGSPTPNSLTDAAADRRLHAMVHELAALAVYFLSGEQPAPAERASVEG
jgi:uncharacterized SAM-binding protein YcdF (DUF218 family)